MDTVQVKAILPRELKRQAFTAFAWHEMKFNRWLEAQLCTWLEEVEWPYEGMAITENTRE